MKISKFKAHLLSCFSRRGVKGSFFAEVFLDFLHLKIFQENNVSHLRNPPIIVEQRVTLSTILTGPLPPSSSKRSVVQAPSTQALLINRHNPTVPVVLPPVQERRLPPPKMKSSKPPAGKFKWNRDLSRCIFLILIFAWEPPEHIFIRIVFRAKTHLCGSAARQRKNASWYDSLQFFLLQNKTGKNASLTFSSLITSLWQRNSVYLSLV